MDLKELMQSPSLALEPPPTLDSVVRREARALRRRRRSVAAALAVIGFAGAVVVVPGLVSRNEPAQVAGAPQVEGSTSTVMLLAEINGAEVVTYWMGSAWCTGVSRVTTTHLCTRRTGPGVDNFLALSGPDSDSLRVDDRQLSAGLIDDDVARVDAWLTDSPDTVVDERADYDVVATTIRRAEGFPKGVWWLEVPSGKYPSALVAYDASGRELERSPSG